MEEERQPSSNPRSKWRTFGVVTLITIKWLFIVGVLGALFAGGAASGYIAALVKDEPVRPRSLMEAKMNENALTGFVYFNDGTTPVGQLRTEEDRRLIDLKDVPTSVIDALLSTEDSNFYNHIGIDFKGFARAIKQKVLNEDQQTGGSTLTQQVARRVFLSLDKTANRKIKEIFLSLRMERYMTKDEILSAYLNKMPFGNGSSGYNLYGIKAASFGIFNITDLHKLNLAQSAYLAGLPQLPSVYSAYNGKGKFDEKGFKKAIERQHVVLGRMLTTDRITQSEYNEALAFDIKSTLAPHRERAYNTFPYLMLETEREAAQLLVLQQYPNLTKADLGKAENADLVTNMREHLQRSGYRIYTTIDKKIYNDMREIGSNPDNFSPYSKSKGLEQIAAIMINHKTGEILGMLEGRDFNTEQMNYATQMTRQPGSTMKPIAAYLPSLENGYIQPAGIIDDSPIVLKDGKKGFHIPMNVNKRFDGLMTAREALNRSLNIPALKLFLNKVGIANAWDFARSLGITTLQPQDEYAQTGVIGGLSKGVSVEELTGAFATIPNMGLYNEAHMISKITDANGKVVYEFKQEPKRVYSEQTAFLMTDMLKTVISDPRGTGKSIQSSFKSYGDIDVAGKTGSTQDYGDVWFMGYTPDVTLGVWAGYKEQINSLSTEGHARARSIWSLVMNAAVKDRPELFPTKKFTQPSGVIKATVSSVSGKLPTQLTRQAGLLVTDWFNEKYLPTDADDVLVNASYITYNGANYIPKDGTPADFLQSKIVIKRDPPLGELMDEIEQAQSKLPEKSRRPMSVYMPTDASEGAPSRYDPRSDDGSAPSAPTGVTLSSAGGMGQITFNSNPEKDVVGYRLYRAYHGAYEKYGKSILTGSPLVFADHYSAAGTSYYVTAVDVAGNESAPSQIVGAGIIPTPDMAPSDPITSEGNGSLTEGIIPTPDINSNNEPSGSGLENNSGSGTDATLPPSANDGSTEAPPSNP